MPARAWTGKNRPSQAEALGGVEVGAPFLPLSRPPINGIGHTRERIGE
jgi:hypothetical protein